jgi:hypothetical protein
MRREYKIVTDTGADALEKKVKDLMAEDALWQPHGGVAFAALNESSVVILFAQAMVRELGDAAD